MNKLAKYREYRQLGWLAHTALNRVRIYEKAKKFEYEGDWYAYRGGRRVEVEDLPNGDEIILSIDYEPYPELPWNHFEGLSEVESHEYGEWLGNGFVDLWRGGRNDYCYKYNFKKALSNALKDAREHYPKMGKAWHMDTALEWVHREVKYFYRYCNDSWCYLWLEARLVRDGEEIDAESIGMVEEDGWEDCADEIVATLARASKAKVYAGSTVGCV